MSMGDAPEPQRDPREDKLPRWAQDQFDLLRMRLREARVDLAETRSLYAATGGDAWLDPFDRTPIPLPAERMLRFPIDMPDGIGKMGAYVDVQLVRTMSGPRVRVSTSDMLAFVPSANNSIEVRPVGH